MLALQAQCASPVRPPWRHRLRLFPRFRRKAPPILDRAGWTDPSGAPVELATPPPEEPGQWEVAVTPGTDDEGWQYGTVFQ